MQTVSNKNRIQYQWKRIIKNNNDLCTNTVYFALEKLHSEEIYSLKIPQNIGTTTSQQYFETLFPSLNLVWKLIYLLTRILTKNTSLRAYQYKVLNHVLYLNHNLFQFRVQGSYTLLGIFFPEFLRKRTVFH